MMKTIIFSLSTLIVLNLFLVGKCLTLQSGRPSWDRISLLYASSKANNFVVNPSPRFSVGMLRSLCGTTLVALAILPTNIVMADPLDLGASDTSNSKIFKGGASTLQQGISKTITRGVNLDGSDFSGKNLRGVAFQQSIVRDSSFKNANLYSASFFEYVPSVFLLLLLYTSLPRYGPHHK